MGNRTPLYDNHVDQGARMVDFGGWDMPVHYGSQVEEHHAVRRDAGIFDVSHMTVVDIQGSGAREYLRRLMANDVDRVGPGRALYTAMLNERGGILDDLIIYKGADDDFRVVVNCATREKDLAWMEQQAAGFQVEIRERPELAMLSVQGPKARERLLPLVTGEVAGAVEKMRPFRFVMDDDWMVATTGYTGEDGVEIVLPGEQAPALWKKMVAAGMAPCGLGARDTLRLEAGLNLYGNDMDENVTPLEAAIDWTVAFTEGRDFIGREALEKQQQEGHPCLVGMVLEGRGVLRPHQTVVTEQGEGEVTSGTFSPTLGESIALARLPAGAAGEARVRIRKRELPVRIVRPPFVRNGERAYRET